MAGRGDPVRQARRRLRDYVRKNERRMDYPTYVSHGWHIGSGTIESACTNVINARPCGTGTRRSAHGADEPARALFKSHRSAWDGGWSRATLT